MPFAFVNRTELAYDIVQSEDVLPNAVNVVLTPGGQSGRAEFLWLAISLVENFGNRVRCLVWDRRGCGESGVNFECDPVSCECDHASEGKGGDGSETNCFRACCNPPLGEPELHADDLASLLTYLGWNNVICVGLSAGARLSLFLALRHPSIVAGIAAMSITAGAVAAFVLSDVYYDQYATAAHTGGMEAVVKKPHYASMISAVPRRREELLSMAPSVFAETMVRYRDFIARSAEYPVIGLTSAQLCAVVVPVFVLRTFPDDSDAMHTLAASQALFEGVLKRVGLVIEEDVNKWLPRLCDFIQSFIPSDGGGSGGNSSDSSDKRDLTTTTLPLTRVSRL